MFKLISRIVTVPFTASKPPKQRTLYYSIESAKTNLDDAENQLKEGGYPPLGGFDGGGGGFMVKQGNLIIDGSGYGEGSHNVAQGLISDAGHGHGGASFGYVVKETRILRIYPLVGIGGGGSGVVGMKKESPSKDRIDIGGGGMLVWIGLGVDLRLPLGKIALVLGFRSGVHIPVVGDKEQIYKGPFMRWNIGVEWGDS